MLSEIEIPKRGRHYRIFCIINDRILNYKQFMHIGAEKLILWKNIRTSLRYVLICDGVNGYLCCFVLTACCISWETREMQSSTLPWKNLFMKKLQKKV